MSKVAIKHMTAAQACDEDIWIERELDILRRQLARLDDELARLHVLQMGWLRSSRAVKRRLTEIATGSDHGVGETARLADAYTKMSDRYVALTDDAMASYREKDVIYRQQDALYKRAKHVAKRRRATRLYTISVDSPGLGSHSRVDAYVEGGEPRLLAAVRLIENFCSHDQQLAMAPHIVVRCDGHSGATASIKFSKDPKTDEYTWGTGDRAYEAVVHEVDEVYRKHWGGPDKWSAEQWLNIYQQEAKKLLKWGHSA